MLATKMEQELAARTAPLTAQPGENGDGVGCIVYTLQALSPHWPPFKNQMEQLRIKVKNGEKAALLTAWGHDKESLQANIKSYMEHI